MNPIPVIFAIIMFANMNAMADAQERIAARRQQIDALDQRIVGLLQERAQVVAEIGVIKGEAHLPVTVPGREQEVIEKAEDLAKRGPLPPEAVGRIYKTLLNEMRNWEETQRTTSP
jgi:chorismate mutase / prephenate dehydratase